MENRVIAILGCTASGKGSVGRALAREIDAEIVSVDSMKVYRGMDIGTAKPKPAELAEVPHHLIDVADPWEAFSAARFVEMADAAVEGIHARGRPVIVVGGTVLYFKFFHDGVFEGPSADPEFRAKLHERAQREGSAALHAELSRVDAEAGARIHPNDMRRIERALEVYHLTGKPISEHQRQWENPTVRRSDWDWQLIGLRRPKEEASRRINRRVRSMVDRGLVEEARRLYDDPRGISTPARQAVGYAELFAHFRGECPLEHAIEQIKIHSRRLAKHQRTWLRREAGLAWVDVAEDDDVAGVCERVRGLLRT